MLRHVKATHSFSPMGVSTLVGVETGIPLSSIFLHADSSVRKNSGNCVGKNIIVCVHKPIENCARVQWLQTFTQIIAPNKSMHLYMTLKDNRCYSDDEEGNDGPCLSHASKVLDALCGEQHSSFHCL